MQTTCCSMLMALALAAGLGARTAHAADAPARVEPPSEPGLGALELLTGFGVGAGGAAAAAGIVLNWSDGAALPLAGGLVLALPALQGLAVCGVGKLSDHYTGGCAWPIAGAYLGAVALAPLAFMGSGDTRDPLGGVLLTATAVGFGVLIGAPIGATWAWNADKVPRQPPAPKTLETASPAGRLPPAHVLPVLSLTF